MKSFSDQPAILVVGSINFDITAKGLRLPQPGETLLGEHFYQALGGKGANQAVAAARAGARVDLLGAVGDDALGATALSTLEAEGVGVGLCRTLQNQPTGVALIMVGENAENAIMVIPGANGRIESDWIEAVDLQQYDAVLFQLEIPIHTVEDMLQNVAKVQKPHIFLTPAPAHRIKEEALQCVDVLIPNEHELPIFSGSGNAGKSALLAARFRMGIALTLGNKGATWMDADGSELFVPAFPVNAIDTVGAGDCFAGYLAVEWVRHQSMETALRKACAAAALKVQRTGAQTGIPLMDEVDAFLSERS